MSKRYIQILSATLLFVASHTAFADKDRIAQGQELAFDRKAGNCLACHMIVGTDQPGTIGPPLVAMKQRFPDSDALKQQISNSLIKNPNSTMPPFGLHNILSDAEIDLVVEYLYTL